MEIHSLVDNVYLHVSYKTVAGYGVVGSNGLIVIDGKDAYIFDTPWTEEDTGKLVDWIQEKGYQVISSISIHSHADRTFG
ncbi:MAG: hypothetical protein KUG78_20150 [Kangiellaceae bacterium]|nr:hypothetical protein [Kangiellaceae bacterium]